MLCSYEGKIVGIPIGVGCALPPVFTTEKAIDRSLYLPAGRWMSYNDKRTLYER